MTALTTTAAKFAIDMTLTPLPDEVLGYVTLYRDDAQSRPSTKMFMWADHNLPGGDTAFERYGREGVPLYHNKDLDLFIQVVPVTVPANWSIQ